MQIASILAPERTFWGVEGCSKKRTLQTVADLLAPHFGDLDSEELFRYLFNREKLGSTGIGQGIAIPHCRIAQCKQITGALVYLDNAVDFDAPDDQKVDLLFILIVPEEANEAHLTTLATLAERFMQADYRDKLRASKNADELFRLATA